ncbi:MAG: GntR family transcriptional regulator, partial [Candidatus Adiutrix sp.]
MLHTRNKGEINLMERRRPKITRVTLKGQAYDYLKSAILHGDLEGGRVYSEQYFANQLEISRTPVREAVLQL